MMNHGYKSSGKSILSGNVEFSVFHLSYSPVHLYTCTVFYTTHLSDPLTPNQVTVVRTGYLLKSPPYSLLKRENSWKRRFFVLFKLNIHSYQLKYFISEEEKDKPLGEIDLTQATVMNVDPYNHPKWKWVQKNTQCSPSCVLSIKALGREYFLVGNKR
ncbi:Pleckstrin y domain-containing family S member 1 [Merluccius polli]|uniref:Pleckstrin y domain-containing family S member 1 n=1 Tax=Merluccius polli TaxID=89951 RepID=A0AA47MAP9_MERPO|nr:Pleckstrin y domain-containing family S member 1 [Merluccius polli]